MRTRRCGTGYCLDQELTLHQAVIGIGTTRDGIDSVTSDQRIG